MRRKRDLARAGDEVSALGQLAQQRLSLHFDRIDFVQHRTQRRGVERILEQKVPVLVISPCLLGADAPERPARWHPFEGTVERISFHGHRETTEDGWEPGVSERRLKSNGAPA